MTIKVPSNRKVQEANEFVLALRDNLASVLSQPFWKRRVPMSEKITYLETLATAKRSLWANVQEQVPETVGKSYTVSSTHIEYEKEEPSEKGHD